MFIGNTSHRHSTRCHRNAEINITNLMDIMMVLLVVFMVAAPLMINKSFASFKKTSSKGEACEKR